MKIHFGMTILFCIFGSAVQGSDLKRDDILSWPRAGLQEFGCFLEREFKHKHPRFNCSLKNYQNEGDPCKNTEAYYEGVEFPASKVNEVDPSISTISLSWEHGDLQSVSIAFKAKANESQIRTKFHLPVKEQNPRQNVMSYSIQDCSLKSNCLFLQGFDHLGEADVECPPK